MVKKNIIKWNRFLVLVREFFNDQKFIEIRTPTLVVSPGLEPFLDPFETEFVAGSRREKLYLPTSPEFHLKKALCIGFKNIFELKECFRNGEVGDHHQPEFMMLEWYRAGKTEKSISPKLLFEDIQNLFDFLSKKLKRPRVKIKIYKMEDIWLEFLDFKLTPYTTTEDLKNLCAKYNDLKFDFEKENDFDDLFNQIWLDKIESKLEKIKVPVIICHYPPSQAALAKLTSDGWADRFELYWKGLELANAFHELNDSKEQRRRFVKDQEKKRDLGKPVVPIDEEFMDYLEQGMPPAVGIALGVERLFMAFENVKNISDLRLFPFKDLSR